MDQLISGRRAFERTTRAATIDAIIGGQPAALPPSSDGVTDWLRAVMWRCLAKRPGDRYPDTRDLALALRQIHERRSDTVASAGLTRRRALRLAWAAAATAGAGLAAWRLWPQETGIRSLAVLPFVNATQEDDAEFLCDGITEGLIHRLARLPSLKVMARSLVFNFKGKSGDPRDIGRRLGVGAILTGTLARRYGRLQITAELVEVATGAELWSDSYDRASADVLVVQDEMAGAIVERGLRLALRDGDRLQVMRRPTASADAYELYSRAIDHFERGTEETISPHANF